jgi:hypothetical protein
VEAPLFGDTVALVINRLRPELGSVPIGARVPNPRPAAFVVVLRTGGVQETPVTEGAQITVEAWSNRSENAHDLAQLCRAHLHAMQGEVVDGVQVYRVDEFSGPGDLPDPVSTQARYTFTVSITVRYVSVVSA